MTQTNFAGPVIQYGITLSSTSGDGITGQDYEHNPQRAPMATDLGDSMLDPRSAYNYDPGGNAPALAFYNNVALVDYVPTAASTVAYVLNTASSGVTTFTLAAASSANGTVSATITAPETGRSVTLLAVDTSSTQLVFGVPSSGGVLNLWAPGGGAGRNVTITPSSNGDAGTYSIAGRDIYGFKMTETIAAGSTNLAGKKAFKYISSITNATTPTSTGIQVGFGNVFGFPFAVNYIGLNAQVMLIPASFGSSASVVALSSVVVNLASTVASQTSTTPDVRGTYASSTAPNGTLRLQMLISPSASAVAAMTATNVSPLFGATQFSSV